uniref:Uncharacterized protein n=1 Tax=Aegilops tauschii subsp. strangulata TaxID=200361 RepID=A0A453I229_AEGTS
MFSDTNRFELLQPAANTSSVSHRRDKIRSLTNDEDVMWSFTSDEDVVWSFTSDEETRSDHSPVMKMLCGRCCRAKC